MINRKTNLKFEKIKKIANEFKISVPNLLTLVALRSQNTLNNNNFGSNSHRDHELEKPCKWHEEYERLGFTMEQAEEMTWAVISAENQELKRNPKGKWS